MSDNFRQQINNTFPSNHPQINFSSSYTTSSSNVDNSNNYNAPDIGTFDGNSQTINLNNIDNNPPGFFLTHPQLLLPPQSQSSLRTPSQPLPLLLGSQQSLIPQQPQPFFSPNSQYTISSPQVSQHIPQQNDQAQFNPRLPYNHNYNNNRNNRLGGNLDDVILNLNDINKDLSKIMNDYGILARRLNNAIQNINALNSNISNILNKHICHLFGLFICVVFIDAVQTIVALIQQYWAHARIPFSFEVNKVCGPFNERYLLPYTW
nr:9674_t:CDS:2 [Entrophospora candida]